jgi:hypothetical protein
MSGDAFSLLVGFILGVLFLLCISLMVDGKAPIFGNLQEKFDNVPQKIIADDAVDFWNELFRLRFVKKIRLLDIDWLANKPSIDYNSYKNNVDMINDIAKDCRQAGSKLTSRTYLKEMWGSLMNTPVLRNDVTQEEYETNPMHANNMQNTTASVLLMMYVTSGADKNVWNIR